MFRQLFEIVRRNIRNRRIQFYLNLVSLSLGFLIFATVLLYFRFETSFENMISKKNELHELRYYMVNNGFESRNLRTPPAFGPSMKDFFPEVLDYTRLISHHDATIEYKESKFNKIDAFHAEANFFELFDYNLKEGEAETALSGPFSIVLTSSLAKTIFGDEPALGKVLKINTVYSESWNLTVGAVVEDLPKNTHLDFDFLISFDVLESSRSSGWIKPLNGHFRFTLSKTYLLLQEGTKLTDIYNNFDSYEETYNEFDNISWNIELVPISKIHLFTESFDDNTFDRQTDAWLIVYFQIVMAVGILMLVLVNYGNVFSILTFSRNKQFSIRKGLGEERRFFLYQLFFENFYINFLALFIVLLGLYLNIDGLNTFFEDEIFSKKSFDAAFLGILGLVLLLGTALPTFAGFITLYGLTAFGITGTNYQALKKTALYRNVSFILQFTVALVTISFGLVVVRQYSYMLGQGIGIDYKNVLVLKIPYSGDKSLEKMDLFKNEVLEHAMFSNVTGNRYLITSTILNRKEFKSPKGYTAITSFNKVDLDFFETFDIDLVEGRLLGTTDSKHIVINERAVQEFGYSSPQEAVGSHLLFDQIGWKFQIVGVVKDYLHEGLKAVPRAMAYLYPKNFNEGYKYFYVRYNPEVPFQEVISTVRGAWSEHYLEALFDYQLLDFVVQNKYRREKVVIKTVTSYTVLLLIIMCLGVYSLTSFKVFRKIKEYSIRKVHGATARDILQLIFKDLFRLILVSFILSAPFFFMLSTRFLSNYHYHIDLDYLLLLLPLLGLCVIVAATIIQMSYKVSNQSPVETLRE